MWTVICEANPIADTKQIYVLKAKLFEKIRMMFTVNYKHFSFELVGLNLCNQSYP
jgi:hypothetical protein